MNESPEGNIKQSITNGITVQVVGDKKIETFCSYVGNNSWMDDGNDKITKENNG